MIDTPVDKPTVPAKPEKPKPIAKDHYGPASIVTHEYPSSQKPVKPPPTVLPTTEDK